MDDWSGVVLAGGRSRRMGRDKALLTVGGRPLATVALDALRGAGASELLAVGGDAAVLAALAALGARPVPDRYPGEGPLGAIVTALQAASQEVVVVLACDLPLVDATAVRSLVDQLGPSADAAVPLVDGRLQVLLAAYRRRCLPALRAAFDAGTRAVHEAVAALDLTHPELTDPRVAQNVNTPDDLAQMAQWTTGSNA